MHSADRLVLEIVAMYPNQWAAIVLAVHDQWSLAAFVIVVVLYCISNRRR